MGDAARCEHHSDRLHIRKTSARGANGSGDALCNLDIACLQVDVEGQQEGTGADTGCSRSGMESRPAHIGVPRRIQPGGGSELLIPALPDNFKPTAFRAKSSGFIEIYGKTQLGPQPMPQTVRPDRAVLQRRISKRNQRNDINRPDAGVNPPMPVQVDSFDRGRSRAEGRFADRVGLPNERENAAMMIGIALPTEEPRAGGSTNRVSNRVDDCSVTPFREVRDAFDDLTGQSIVILPR